MEIKKLRRQKVIIRAVAITLLAALTWLLRNCGGRFSWEAIPIFPLVYLMMQYLFQMGKSPTMKERVKHLTFYIVVLVFTGFMSAGFNLEAILHKIVPLLLGGILAIPLLFVEPLHKNSWREED